MNATEDRAAPDGESLAQVALDLELCKVCGICIELCPEDVFDRDKLGYPIVARAEDCTSCLLCEIHCPDFAIEVQRRARKKPAQGAAATPEAIAEAASDRVKAALAARPDHDERPVTGSECGVHGGGDD
ncbi:MAG: ferredoxin family protein [Actinobacteria bacterium]|nr:ferredoxin family protein [Actinomycetota bacterium]